MTDIHVPDTEEPDFTAPYEPHVDGDGGRMTPRMASYLWGAATILGDEWQTCITDPELLAGLRSAGRTTRWRRRRQRLPRPLHRRRARAAPHHRLGRGLSAGDHDVLMLFNPTLDGVDESPAIATAYLHPRDWFRPFRPVDAAG